MSKVIIHPETKERELAIKKIVSCLINHKISLQEIMDELIRKLENAKSQNKRSK